MKMDKCSRNKPNDIKSAIKRCVMKTGNIKMHTRVWSENLKGTDHSEDVEVDGMISGCILEK
jgi:hypothetical protein